MKDYKEFFNGKKITLMGLGLLGRGVNVAAFLAKCGAILTVTDLKNREVLESSLDQLKKFKNIRYTLGRHEIEDFRNKDMIIKAADAPLDSPYIKEARKNGIPVEMDASLFTRLSHVQIIGVTGTRGKSTTAHLIYEILKKVFRSSELSGKNIYLAGNVRGVATLPLLERVKEGDLVVLELDSWQLQGFGDSKLSPHIAVFTNFMPDHLNYYKGSMQKYFNDKHNIFKYQNKNDYLIISRNSKEAIRKFSKIRIDSKILEVSGENVSNWRPKLIGKHNLENIALAVKTAELFRINGKTIKEVVESFNPIEGRLELIREYQGIKIYNDTNSTTPEATLAGIKAVANNRNVVLIMGGADKGLKMDRLLKSLADYCQAVILMPGAGTEKIKNKIKKIKNLKSDFAVSLAEAVQKAVSYSKKGNVILFSPGFASFGLFRNEYDRGDQFKKIVADLKEISRIHFIGIGGIGISAIARMMLEQGKVVTGSDMSRSEVTDRLKELGAKIFIDGQDDLNEKSKFLSKADLVVYTLAISEDNPDLKRVRELGIKAMTYPEALGLVSSNRYTIAIAGTHGKTTTTAILAKVCIDAGLDPTVIVGSLLKNLRSNFISGRGDLFIAEACEYKKSFLNLNPDVLVITNIDNDHLDFYKNLTEIQQAFRELAVKVPNDGFIVCDKNNPRLKPVIRGLRCKIVDYSEIKLNLRLKIPGRHNIDNAKAVLAVAKILKIDSKKTANSLERFEGTWRRFDYKGRTQNGVLVYDDYAHHPTEIRATLEAFTEKFPGRKIIVVFQPHLFSRTKLLLNEFAGSFVGVDRVLILPIYAAREEIDETVNSKILAEKINKKSKNAIYFSEFKEASKYLKEQLKKDDVLVTMGAGDIYKLGESLL